MSNNPFFSAVASPDVSSRPAYIAGVTNPIFESSRQWDLFLDISTGHVTVAKDIHFTYPPSSTMGLSATVLPRAGTLKAESSIGGEDDGGRGGKDKIDSSKDNNADKVFIEDVSTFVLLVLLLIVVNLSPAMPRFARQLKITLERALFACALRNM